MPSLSRALNPGGAHPSQSPFSPPWGTVRAFLQRKTLVASYVAIFVDTQCVDHMELTYMFLLAFPSSCLISLFLNFGSSSLGNRRNAQLITAQEQMCRATEPAPWAVPFSSQENLPPWGEITPFHLPWSPPPLPRPSPCVLPGKNFLQVTLPRFPDFSRGGDAQEKCKETLNTFIFISCLESGRAIAG